MTTETALYSVDHERALIGSVLVNPDCFRLLDIRAEDFYIVRHRWIWEVIVELDREKLGIDFLTIEQRLVARRQLEELGGAGFLTQILTQTPYSVNAESYAQTVKDYATRRQMLQLANAMAKSAHDLQTPTDAALTDLSVRLPQLARAKGGAKHVGEYASRHFDRVSAAADDNRKSVTIPTGFVDFDRLTFGGMRQGEFMILTGKPGMGKTKWVLQAANWRAQNGYAGAVFEMETDEDEIMDREFSRQTHIPSERFEVGDLRDDDWNLYVQKVERMTSPDYKLLLDFTPTWSTLAMRAELIRLKALYGIQWFIVDYMKFMSDGRGILSEVERLNLISGSLKMICRELKLNGIAIHHLNKAGLNAEVPDFASLTQGSDIVFDADKVTVLTPHIPPPNQKKDDRLATMVFIKSRRKIAEKFYHLVQVKDYPEFGALAKGY